MPRGPRLYAPGVLEHVMARGIERRKLFRDNHDRDDFLRRLAALTEAGAMAVYAWALMPNHFHLLVRTGSRPLSRSMRSLLTGYAGNFNRRHRRSGHLLHNRYKSIVCDEEPYFLELVRYIHLNPLRAGIVRGLRGLARYPYSGPTALVGKVKYRWQDTGAVLGHFGVNLRSARRKYEGFVADGASRGRRPEFQGGGLVRSSGGWRAVQKLRRGREGYVSDERILGGSTFVEEIRQEIESERKKDPARGYRAVSLEEVLKKVCQAEGVRPGEVAGGGRRAVQCRVREGVAYLWIEWLGHSGVPAARAVGIRREGVYRVAERGRQQAKYWQKVLKG